MNKEDNNHRFLNMTDCPDQSLLLDYIEGRTHSEMKRRIELHLVDCPLCSDAVEGLMLMEDRNALAPILMETRAELFEQSKIAQLPIPESKSPRTRRIQRVIYIGIAASLALLLTSYFGIRFLGMSDVQKETISMETPESAQKNNIQESTKEDAPVEAVTSEQQVNSQTNTPDGKNAGAGDFSEGISDQTLGQTVETRNQTKDPDLDKGYYGDLKTLVPGLVEGEDERDALGWEASKDAYSPVTAVEEVTVMDAVTTTTANGEVVSGKKESNRKEKNSMPATGGVSENKVTPAQAQEPQRALNEGMDYYNDGDYPKAGERFDDALEADPGQSQALYYKGMSFYYEKNYEEAIKTFNTLLREKNSAYYQAAQWQLAVVYIESGNNKQARKTLNEIIDGNGSYRSPAEEAIKNLGGQ
jgi:FimV-like protein